MKREIVLKVLRGDDIELLSREYEVTISEISNWRDIFINSGTNGFKRQPQAVKLREAERVIGRLQMELELQKKKNSLIKKINGR
ncbi:MAG: hypothetical protein U9R08_06405 [Nanoarchaeota archaeon]|nr:hypothetical protein [Nanoarchaeota archaeon]